MRYRGFSRRTGLLILVLCVLGDGSLVGAERLLAIPAWLPTEPGGQFEYRASESNGKGGSATLEVREVTHGTNAYTASAHVTLRTRGEPDAEFDVDLFYASNELTLKAMEHSVVVKNVLPANKAGDIVDIEMPDGWMGERPVSIKAKVVSLGTKVAIGDARWDDALVVAGKVSDDGPNSMSFKATLSPPEGVIRYSVTSSKGFGGTVELVPPRRPFDE